MIPAILIDLGLLFILVVATKRFDFEMDSTRWLLWKGVGWLVVAISGLDYGWQGAVAALVLIGLAHRLIPIGWWIVAGLTTVLIC